eukprot:TRINITY_DN64877_c0_g1_i1.p1 TRINITY_DN64877_c0_g1~~TRINITY_DN64877_c0_g1_i1.p1  ORF type:complete len:215 (+),score=37.08 TRINITY_DN64877_c0_g1_i1:36-680(+)
MALSEVLRIDAECSACVHRLSLGLIGDYAVLPGAMLFGWRGIGPVLIAVGGFAGAQSCYLTILALALGQVVNRAAKVVLQRARPVPPPAGSVARAVGVRLPGPNDPDGASFPSGDTMAGSAVGAALALSGGTAAWWLLGLYAGFARVYFWCHFLLDALCGYAVGALAAVGVSILSDQGRSLAWWHVAVAALPFYLAMQALKKCQAAAHSAAGKT